MLIGKPMDVRGTWTSFALEPTGENFQPLYDATKRLVWTLCRRILGDEGDAADAFQSTYCRLLLLAREGGAGAAMEDPVRQIARCAIQEADRTRKARIRRRVRESSYAEGANRMSLEDRGPEGEVEREESRERVEGIVADLPEAYRLPVQLHFFHGLSQRDVAAALDLPLSTVSDRIRQALRRLEPLFRRAGLAGAQASLGAAVAAATLFEPKLSAAVVFERAMALAKVSAVNAAASTPAPNAAPSSISASLSTPVSSLPVSTTQAFTAFIAGLGIMKAKAILLALLLAALSLTALLSYFPRAVHRANPVVRPAPEVQSSPPPQTALAPAPANPQPATAPTSPKPEDAISGVVVDAVTREPLPGATVRQGAREAVADASGAYVLESPEAVQRELVATADGHARQLALVSHVSPALSRHDFALEPAVRVKVAIVDSESRPVPGAHVTPPWQGTGGVYRPDLTVTAGADGIAWIEGVMRRTPPEILVEAGGWRSTYFQPQPREGEDTVECRVVLERLEARIRRRAIVGTVTDPMSRAIAGATIEWKDGEGTSYGDGAVYGQFRATSGADGEYRLEFDDDYDTCALGVAAPGWAPQVADRVQPGEPDAPARKDFTLERGHWLAGRALDEQGGPLAGVQVRAMPRLDLLGVAVAYPAVLREAVTDAEGRFRLEDLPGPKAALELAARDRRPRLEALVDVDQEVDIAVPGYGTIRGVVVDEATGDPVPAFTVKISGVSLNANRVALGESFTSPEGRFILKDLDSGATHTLYVEADGYMTAVQEGVVPASSTALRIALSRGKPLKGQVIDAPSGQPIAGALLLAASADRLRSIQAADAAFLARLPVAAEVQRLSSDATGSFVLREAKPLGLLVFAPGHAKLSIPVDARGRYAQRDGRLRIVLERGVKLRGTCYDRGAPARRVEVRLERAGGEWDTANEMDRAYARLTTDSEGRFAWDDLGIGTYSLKTDRAVAGPGPSFKVSVCRRIEVATLEDREVDLGKERGTSTIRGSIGGMEDMESLGITVTLRPLDDLESDELEFSTYREWAWKYVCPDLKSGKYSVSVSFWQAGATRAVDLAPIEVGAAVEPTIEVPATAEAR